MVPRKITSLIILIACTASISSCGANKTKNEGSIKSNPKIESQVTKIESAFERGDDATACKLQVSLVKNSSIYSNISSDLMKKLKGFQIRCGSGSLSFEL